MDHAATWPGVGGITKYAQLVLPPLFYQKKGDKTMLTVDSENNITLTRGDTAILTLTVKKNGSDYDFSDDLTQFTVKRNTVTSEIVFQKCLLTFLLYYVKKGDCKSPFCIIWKICFTIG